MIDATPPVVSTASFPTLGEPVPSTVTFQLAELSSEPAGSYSNVSTYQTLVQVLGAEWQRWWVRLPRNGCAGSLRVACGGLWVSAANRRT